MKKLELPKYKKGDKLKILRNKVGGGKEEIEVLFESYIPQSTRFYCLFKGYKFGLELSKIIIEEVETDIAKKESIIKVSKKRVLTEKNPTKTQRIISLLARKIPVKEIQTITNNNTIPIDYFNAFKAFDDGDFSLKSDTMEKHYITYKILRDGK